MRLYIFLMGTIREQARYDTAQAPTIRPAGYDNGNVNGNGNQRAATEKGLPTQGLG